MPRKKGPTSSDIVFNGSKLERRDMAWGDYYGAMGRSTVDGECPFCHDNVRAYLWSLAGHGKRCRCGALLDHDGNAYHFKERDQHGEG